MIVCIAINVTFLFSTHENFRLCMAKSACSPGTAPYIIIIIPHHYTVCQQKSHLLTHQNGFREDFFSAL